MWRNRITIEHLKNGKACIRLRRSKKTATGTERQKLTKNMRWVKAVEGEDIEPFIICEDIRRWA
jgi:hypothetical protein